MHVKYIMFVSSQTKNTNLPRRTAVFKNLKIKHKFALLVAIFVIGFMAFGTFAKTDENVAISKRVGQSIQNLNDSVQKVGGFIETINSIPIKQIFWL